MKKINLMLSMMLFGTFSFAGQQPVVIPFIEGEQLNVSLSRVNFNRVFVEGEKIVQVSYPQGGFDVDKSETSVPDLKEMTVKATDLRLTYSPDTVESRYSTLLHLVPANFQESFKQQLDEEIATVKSKNISSVFYAEKVAVDVNHHQGQIEGELYRTSHGLEVNPQHKAYLLQFAFKQGVLSLKSVKEVSHEKN